MTLMNISVMRTVNITQHYQIFRVKSAWTQIKPCVMQSCNKLPSRHFYWSTMKSTNPSEMQLLVAIFNKSIRNAIASCGFKLFFTKFHFNNPHKPQGTSKFYYREKVTDCIKKQSLKHDFSWQTFKRCTRKSTCGRALASEKKTNCVW